MCLAVYLVRCLEFLHALPIVFARRSMFPRNIPLTTVMLGRFLINRQNYKSIELFANVNPDLIESLAKVKRSDNVRVVVISR